VIYGISSKAAPLPSLPQCSTSYTVDVFITLSFLMLFVYLVLSGYEVWFATLAEECGFRVCLAKECFGSK
jgi:hypothetical protein